MEFNKTPAETELGQQKEQPVVALYINKEMSTLHL